MTTELFGDDMRRAWGAHARRMLSQPYLMALLLGSLLLSAASFFTTFVGMNSFAPNLFVNFCIVFAIQALLFVTSWRIGFALADREALPLFTIFVFLISLATSVFFSWVALFGTINTPAEQERSRITRIQRAVEDTNTALFARLNAQQQRQVDALIDSAPYQAWSDTVERVGAEAIAAREVIEAQRDAAATAAARRIQELESRKAQLLADAAGRAERAESGDAELTRLQEERPALVERLNRLRGEFDVANEAVIVQEGLMDAEENGGAAGRGTGRGPVWRSLRDRREILAAERDAKERLLRDAEARLRATDSQIEQLTQEVAAARGASVDAEVSTIDRRLTEITASQSASGPDPNGSLEEDVERMQAQLAAFSTSYELERLDGVAATCVSLLDILRSNESLAGRVGDLSCDRSQMSELINPIRVSADARDAIAARCAPNGAQSSKITELGFEDGVSYGRECIALSKLPNSAIDDLRGEIDRLVIEEDPDAGDFVRTLNAWNARDKLAFLALAIAVFIDLLVLFSGLIGALSGSSSLRRALGWRTAQKTLDDFKQALEVFGDPRAAARDILEVTKSYSGPWRLEQGQTIGSINVLEFRREEYRNHLRSFLTSVPSLADAKPLDDRRGWRRGSSGGARSENEFLVSDRLMSALRAIATGKERFGADDEAPAATIKALTEDQRRRAAEAILRAAHPYSDEEKDTRFAARVNLKDLQPPTAADPDDVQSHARVVLLALHKARHALGLTSDETDGATGGKYWLTTRAYRALEERVDDEPSASVASDPDLEGDDGRSSNGGIWGQMSESKDPGDLSPERALLDAIELLPGKGKKVRGRFGRARVFTYKIDLTQVSPGLRRKAKNALVRLHAKGEAYLPEATATEGETMAYLIARSGLDMLDAMAKPDHDQLEAPPRRPLLRGPAEPQKQVPAPASARRLSYDENTFDRAAPDDAEWIDDEPARLTDLRGADGYDGGEPGSDAEQFERRFFDKTMRATEQRPKRGGGRDRYGANRGNRRGTG